MIDPLAQPIAHIPPRPPISLRPVYPEAEHKLEWEVEIEEAAWRAQVGKGERLWAVVVEFAKGRGVIPQPVASERTSEAGNTASGHSGGGWSAAIEAVMANNEFFDGLMAELEDGRNTTDEWTHEVVVRCTYDVGIDAFVRLGRIPGTAPPHFAAEISFDAWRKLADTNRDGIPCIPCEIGLTELHQLESIARRVDEGWNGWMRKPDGHETGD